MITWKPETKTFLGQKSEFYTIKDNVEHLTQKLS